MSIFISHFHSDAKSASCFEKFLETITSKRIQNHRSSKGSLKNNLTFYASVGTQYRNNSIQAFLYLSPPTW